MTKAVVKGTLIATKFVTVMVFLFSLLLFIYMGVGNSVKDRGKEVLSRIGIISEA